MVFTENEIQIVITENNKNKLTFKNVDESVYTNPSGCSLVAGFSDPSALISAIACFLGGTSEVVPKACLSSLTLDTPS